MTRTIIDGQVVASDPTREAYTVTCPGHGTYSECRWAAPPMLGLLGFKLRGRLPVGTNVVLSPGRPNWIIGTVPSGVDQTADGANLGNRKATMVLEDDENFTDILESELGPGAAARYGMHSLPGDMLEGEFDYTNYLGVILRFLAGMTGLDAGGMARVEVCLANDMVRIISRQFEHHSTLGETVAWDDGRPNQVRRLTSYEHESFGRMPGMPLAEMGEGNQVAKDMASFRKRVLETGRWRWEEYTGFLGDFLHLFLSDPEQAIGEIGGDAFKSGKIGVSVGMDGSFSMRTVGDVSFEKVLRVVVPRHDKRHDDPEGTQHEDYDGLEKQYLKIWKFPKDPKKYPETIYQLREYARWLSCFKSYARFHQLEAKGEDYKVPKESEVVAPRYTCREEDKEQANGEVDYYEVYACVRILRTGAVVHMDSRSNAIVLPGHGGDEVQITATKNMLFQATGDMRFIAGQGLAMKARRSIELSAIKGGITMRAKAWYKILVEKGSFWLKTDTPSEAPAPDDPDEDPAIEIYPKGDKDNACGIILETTRADLLIQVAGKTVVRNPDKTGDTVEAGSIFLQPKVDLKVDVKEGGVFARFKKNMSVEGGGDSEVFLTKVGKLFFKVAKEFRINSIFRLLPTAVHVKRLRINLGWVKSGFYTKPELKGPNGMKNHVQVNTNDWGAEIDGAFPDTPDDGVLPAATNLTDPWKHPEKAKEYDFPGERYYESLAQQACRLDSPMSGDYKVWKFSDDILKEDRNQGAPWPGEGAVERIWSGDEKPLGQVLDKAYKDLKTSGTELTARGMELKYHKHKGTSYDDTSTATGS
jgi:hypothetical protein